MKLFKRIGSALLAAVTLTSMLAAPALAAEPSGGIAVQLDGRELAFTDAAPEITSDRTFLPFRAVLEAMGAEVGYDAQTQTVSASRDGVELALVIGQKSLVITENGEKRTVEMDAAPYIKPSNGRTYIPVRYAAEAFGYSVGWDQDDQTVILVDVEALFGDADFTLMDNFAAYCSRQEAPENMSISGTLTADVTDKSGQMLSKPLKLEGSLEGVAGEKGVQLTGTIDGAVLYAILGAIPMGPDGSAAGDLTALLDSLPDVTAELRADLDSKMLYVSLPDLMGIGESTWYSVDLTALEEELFNAIDMTQLTRMEEATIKEALVWVMQNIPLDDKDVDYVILSMMAQMYVNMLSDKAFTKQENGYVLKTTLEDIVNLEITLVQEGEDIVALELAMSVNVEEDGEKVAFSMNEFATPDRVSMTMDLSMDMEQASLAIKLELNCAPTDKTPVTQPPAGVQVIPAA